MKCGLLPDTEKCFYPTIQIEKQVEPLQTGMNEM